MANVLKDMADFFLFQPADCTRNLQKCSVAGIGKHTEHRRASFQCWMDLPETLLSSRPHISQHSKLPRKIESTVIELINTILYLYSMPQSIYFD